MNRTAVPYVKTNCLKKIVTATVKITIPSYHPMLEEEEEEKLYYFQKNLQRTEINNTF